MPDSGTRWGLASRKRGARPVAPRSNAPTYDLVLLVVDVGASACCSRTDGSPHLIAKRTHHQTALTTESPARSVRATFLRPFVPHAGMSSICRGGNRGRRQGLPRWPNHLRCLWCSWTVLVPGLGVDAAKHDARSSNRVRYASGHTESVRLPPEHVVPCRDRLR